MRVSLADFIQCSLLNLWQKPWVCRKIVLDRDIFSPSPNALMVLKTDTGLSNRRLVEYLVIYIITKCSAES